MKNDKVSQIITGMDIPTGLCVDVDGRITVVANKTGNLLVFDNNGKKLCDFKLQKFVFQNPHCVAVDGDGDIYVADLDNSRFDYFMIVIIILIFPQNFHYFQKNSITHPNHWCTFSFSCCSSSWESCCFWILYQWH